MSSHHIVTEDQEPALIIDHADSVAIAQFNQLLEWSPTVIVHDKNLETIADMGVKIDVLISSVQAELPQDHISLLPFAGTFLDTALAYLNDSGCRAANILTNDTDPSVLLQWVGRINAILLGNGRRTFAVKSGFRKWKIKGETVYVYGDQEVSTTSGLIQQGPGCYHTEKDGFYTIYFAGPYGVIGEIL